MNKVYHNRRTGAIRIVWNGCPYSFRGDQRAQAFLMIRKVFGRKLGKRLMERLVRERMR